jgi:aminopeptidase N
MNCVKKAMRWDEEAYGREYDLDIFMIVAISDFNMGAMENKGLNIFNAKYILVQPETATDLDYENVLIVVGHEYFHNWTGDRITCRDWFQLSLKEGLTVFREQQFTQEMTSSTVARIGEVRTLRDAQFKEDASPLAHPVRPDSYIEINNFYTMTVYNKGAEVIRMLQTLLGKNAFRQGMDHYFEQHDGQAVTIEDFVKSFEAVSQRDFSQFRLWYAQSGTPELHTECAYDAASKIFTLTVKQICPPTPGQAAKKPFHLPLALGLLDSKGEDLPLQLLGETQAQGTNRILEISKETETFQFINVAEKPVPSLLRDFSAPVKLFAAYSDAELYFLLTHDSNDFNRWEAGQQIAARLLLALLEQEKQGKTLVLPELFVAAMRSILTDAKRDEALIAELLILPSESYLGDLMPIIAVDGIHRVRQFARRELARQLASEFLTAYQARASEAVYSVDGKSIARRSLKNICLSYLMLLDNPSIKTQCLQQFQQAQNMTDSIAALAGLVNSAGSEREQALADFYQRWQHESLVIDKWFGLQASCELPNTLAQVKILIQHPAFDYKNPNRVRSVVGAFCQNNLAQFHAENGAGYQFLADQVLIMNRLNPQIAARLVLPLINWRRYDAARQALMRSELQRISAVVGLSKDVQEIVSKSLENL